MLIISLSFWILFFILRADNARDERHALVSKNTCTAGSEARQLRKKPIQVGQLTLSDNSSVISAGKRSILESNCNKKNLPIFRKLDHKKALDWKVETTVPNVSGSFEVDYKETDENVPERRNVEKNRLSKPETKRLLFVRNSDDKMHRSGGTKSESRVVPCQEKSPETTVAVNNFNDFSRNHKECDDLVLIRHQLVQIEKQQSSLLDLLQVCVRG